MPTTLTYGRKVPQDTDGQVVWTEALEQNIARDDAHDHDGSNSKALPPTAVQAVTQSIAASAWVSQGGGTYKQTVTLPGSLQFDDLSPTFKVDDDIIFPTIEKVSATTYDIYINDNSKSVTAVYR